MDDADVVFIKRAIALSAQCVAEPGKVTPRVGVVVARDGRLLADAFRGELAAGEHAEFTALEKKLFESIVAGATVYTTLEPCTTRNHPKVPCAERLIERKVSRVVIGMLDPNPAIRGRGVRLLRDHNVATELFPAALAAQVEDLNRHFRRSIEAQSTVPVASSALHIEASGNHRITDSLVLFVDGDGRPVFVESERVEVGAEIRLTLRARDAADSAALALLRQDNKRPIPIAFGVSAVLAHVKSVVQTIDKGDEIWQVVATEDARDYGDSFSQDMGFGTISADDLAVLRARRILLDEKAVRPGVRQPSDAASDINDVAFEMFVRGFKTPLEVERSPFPGLYEAMGADKGAFPAAARLLAVLWLRLTMATERILRLDLDLVDGPALRVRFIGERARRYSNAAPYRIEVEGACSLANPGDGHGSQDPDEPGPLDVRVEVDEAFARAMTALTMVLETMNKDAEANRRWAAVAGPLVGAGRSPTRKLHELVNQKADEFADLGRQLRPLVAQFRDATDRFFAGLESLIALQVRSGVSSRGEMIAGLERLGTVDEVARRARDTYSQVAATMASLPTPTLAFKRKKREAAAEAARLAAAIDAWLQRSGELRGRVERGQES